MTLMADIETGRDELEPHESPRDLLRGFSLADRIYSMASNSVPSNVAAELLVMAEIGADPIKRNECMQVAAVAILRLSTELAHYIARARNMEREFGGVRS